MHSMNSMDVDGPMEEVPEYVPMQKYTRMQGEIQRKNEDNLRRFQDIEKRQQMYCIFIIICAVIGMIVGITGIALGVWGRGSFKELKNHIESTVYYCAEKDNFVGKPTKNSENITQIAEVIKNYNKTSLEINEVDKKVGFNLKSGEFTAPVKGVYEITAHFHKNDIEDTNTEPSAVSITKNDKPLIEGKMENPGKNADTTSVSILVKMEKMDKASLYFKAVSSKGRGIKDITLCVSRVV